MNRSVSQRFSRALAALAALAALFLADGVSGHGPDSQYYALIDDFHANPSTTDATGEIFLTLNSEQTELSYRIVLDDLLGLKPNPADRTEPDDILGIHLHLHVPDTIGPHVLNIFGLATYGVPGEEDADLIVDYVNHTLSGVFDISDASRDPDTGEILPQFFFLTSKVVTDWIDELNAGELVVAVHTNESGFANFALHGHIGAHAHVPEPATSVLLVAGISFLWSIARTRRRAPADPCQRDCPRRDSIKVRFR